MKDFIDDAKKKAAEAKDRATQEAGEAMAKAIVGQAERRVASVVDGWLDSAEQALSDAEGEVAGRRKAAGLEPQDAAPTAEGDSEDAEVADPVEDAEPVEQGPTADEREAALRDRLAALKAQRAALPPAPEPPPEQVTAPVAAPVEVDDRPGFTPAPTPRDPYAEANAVLERAAEARGGDPVTLDTPMSPDLGDPFAAAEAALARARESRVAAGTYREPVQRAPVTPQAPRSVDDVLARAAEARAIASKGRRGIAAEADARKALARMKAARGMPSESPVAVDDEDDLPTEPGARPRKRTL